MNEENVVRPVRRAAPTRVSLNWNTDWTVTFPGVEVGTGRGLVTVAPAKWTRTPGPRLLAHRPGIVATVPLGTAEQRRDASPALLSHKINPFEAKPEDVILFLQELLDSGSHKYGTFGSHRAALSLLLPGNIGADPVLSRFLKGVSRIRPPAPRYTVTWDPSPVLRFLEQMDTPNLKTLSKKLTTLLVLATGQRLQTISLIRLSGLQQSTSGLRIFIKDWLKTSGIKKNQPVLSIPYFQEKPKLCVATTILHYVNMTASMRQEEDFLFLTTTKPHSAASKQTISRWPHSTRHASTSSAHRLGISIDQIKQCAGWSPNSETFARFYNRPVVEPGQYVTKILSSAT
ncbi:hypothetical protein MTP99_002615 [Tenebrio molitor]|nr:hypothetical protein MTP99_002615 [Tenebrio molitor]